MNTYYPIHILVAVPCPPSIRDRFSTQFGSQCHFTFINSSQTIPESLLRHTDVIIGEPDEPDLTESASSEMAAADMGRRRQIRTYETVAFPSDDHQCFRCFWYHYIRICDWHYYCTCIDHFQFIHIIRQLTLGFHLTIVARFTKKQS